MLILVLANNMLFLYLGWEGVGLCSYLLIGFWYKDPANGYAARKAFVVTRVGDTAMAIGLILLFTNLGTLNIQELLQHAAQQWEVGSSIAIAIAILLLGGAVGKSAQLPLQTWLPDAMAGPTPVSALIHAATMVTAGVYLIARTHVIFELAPVVQALVAIVGALTLLISGFSAITQVDIKRVLAYSTISQIGYMFLALGVGAWSAAVFHFMIHAFFKALLFLGAGVIILTLHHEHDMFKMGGLRKQLPVVFWTFLIASGALSAFPLISAGFYSKDQIIWYAWSSKSGNPLLWVAALVGAFVTSIYTFRMVFITFFGEAKAKITHKPGFLLNVPLIVLAVLSVIGGFIELPHTFGNFTPFSNFLHNTLPAVRAFKESMTLELLFQIISAVTSLIGIYLAYLFVIRNPEYIRQLRSTASGALLQRFLFAGWGFDWLYDKVIVHPYVWLAQIDKQDFIDLIFEGLARGSQLSHRILSQTQTGFLRKYAMGIAIGAIIAIGVVIFL
jgi:NADH-quinone oxidoreductase subunit L